MISREYESMLLSTINARVHGVQVTDLIRMEEPRLGYSGTVYYQDEVFPFEAEIDFEKMDLNISVRFPLKIKKGYRDGMERLIILTNSLIEREGTVCHDGEDGICLLRTISLTETVTADYADHSMLRAAGIVYAFSPYFQAVNLGARSFIHNGCVIGLIVNQLLYSFTDETAKTLEVIEPDAQFRDEVWYDLLEEQFEEACAHAADKLADYERSTLKLW